MANKDIPADVKEKNGDLQDLVNYCMDLYEEAKGSKYRENKKTEMEESTKAYEQVEESASDPWEGAHNTVLPLTTISVDNVEPRMVAGFVGKRPFVRFEMENDQEQDEPTKIAETWFDQELEDVVRIEDVAGDVAHKLCLEGTVFPMAVYDFDEVVRRDFVLIGQEPEELIPVIKAALQTGELLPKPEAGVYIKVADGKPMTHEQAVSMFEGGKVECLSFSDIFIPDDAEDWEKTPVIRKVRPTYAELERDSATKDGFRNIDKELLKGRTEKLQEDDQTPTQKIDEVEVTGKEVVECIECYVSYIYKDEDDEDEDIRDWTETRLVVQIALDRGVVVRIQKLMDVNFKNEHIIKRVRLYPEKGKSYGTPVYGKMKAIQKGASKTFNLSMNIAEVVLIPWFLFTDKVGLKEGVKLKPGMGIPVDSVDGLYFPSFSINPAQMAEFLTLWITFWERLISIGDLQVGRTSQKDTTATEVLAVIEEGNVKHNYQVTTVKKEFRSLVKTLYDLYYQNMPLDKTFLWNGQEIPLPRSALARPYKFRLTGSSELSNKLIKRKESEDMYQMTMGNPVANPIWSLTKLVESYGHTDASQAVDPTINQIVQAIQEIPGAAELFQESLQQAMQMAQQQQNEASAAAGAAMGGANA